MEDSLSYPLSTDPDAAAAEETFVGVEKKGRVATVHREVVDRGAEPAGFELQAQMVGNFLKIAIPVFAA